MIARLFVSFVLAALALWGLSGLRMGDQSRLALTMVVIGALGYHRHLMPKGGPMPRVWPAVADAPKLDAVWTLWGLKLSKPRSVRLRTTSVEFSKANPGVSRVFECLPEILRIPARKLLLRTR